MSERRPWRRCSACGGVCHWHDTDWVCSHPDCGSEWCEDHAPRFAPPGATRVTPATIEQVRVIFQRAFEDSTDAAGASAPQGSDVA
jgi:hypothetical protein